jgi:hypothetical protein
MVHYHYMGHTACSADYVGSDEEAQLEWALRESMAQ